MKTFTVNIDDKLDKVLDDLKESFGKTSRAEVFRMGVALLKIADEARKKGRKLVVADEADKVEKEILIPG
ncbi:MAG: hypothetical protein HY000_37335 [Planctomycetes bacterium]|nr:hypothetical protein [Planctomycetota bacterium]